MLEITEVLEDFRAYDRAGFLERHPYPVLLHQTNPGDAEAPTGFITGLKKQNRRATLMSSDPLAEHQTARSATGLLVFPVRPVLPGAPEQRVQIGRDPGCDIQLPYDKVSAHHALLVPESDGSWSIEDQGATNGTFVEGERLEAKGRRVLRSGTHLKLGTAAVTFYSADGFHDYLTSLRRAPTGPAHRQ